VFSISTTIAFLAMSSANLSYECCPGFRGDPLFKCSQLLDCTFEESGKPNLSFSIPWTFASGQSEPNSFH
jgi:hypothetical protein